jgi:hypothetical protein
VFPNLGPRIQIIILTKDSFIFFIRYTTCKDDRMTKKEGDVIQWSSTQFTGAGNMMIQF